MFIVTACQLYFDNRLLQSWIYWRKYSQMSSLNVAYFTTCISFECNLITQLRETLNLLPPAHYWQVEVGFWAGCCLVLYIKGRSFVLSIHLNELQVVALMSHFCCSFVLSIHLNELQVVALMSHFCRSFVLSIHSNELQVVALMSHFCCSFVLTTTCNSFKWIDRTKERQKWDIRATTCNSFEWIDRTKEQQKWDIRATTCNSFKWIDRTKERQKWDIRATTWCPTFVAPLSCQFT
jgi:hypothetical protein